jgi:flagellar basal body P-ring formation protein FlgA
MMTAARHLLRLLALCTCWLEAGLADPAPGAAPIWTLRTSAQADSAGVYLDQLFVAGNTPLPHLRLAPAPAFGQTASFTRAQLTELLRTQTPDLFTTNWTGPGAIKVTRRLRDLNEAEARDLLTATLQREVVKDKGDLELRLTRAWTPVAVPDEPLTLKVTDLPASGLLPNCIVRFELRAGEERVGNWQLALQARIWREVPVATTPLKRGQPLRAADLGRDRRDLFTLREPALNPESLGELSELTENLQPGQAVLARSVRQRPAIARGRLVEAVVQDGALSISMKVEALEDGSPGQIVRIRNPKTRREFTGQVQNEQTILVLL